MHRSELEQAGNCVACGVEVNPTERVFPLGDDEFLCIGCAIARHGIYDERHDRWTTPPEVADLMH